MDTLGSRLALVKRPQFTVAPFSGSQCPPLCLLSPGGDAAPSAALGIDRRASMSKVSAHSSLADQLLAPGSGVALQGVAGLPFRDVVGLRIGKSAKADCCGFQHSGGSWRAPFRDVDLLGLSCQFRCWEL